MIAHRFRYTDLWDLGDECRFGTADVFHVTRGDNESPDERYARLDQYDEFVDWLNGGVLAAAVAASRAKRLSDAGVMSVLYKDGYGSVFAAPVTDKGDTIRVVAVNT